MIADGATSDYQSSCGQDQYDEDFEEEEGVDVDDEDEQDNGQDQYDEDFKEEGVDVDDEDEQEYDEERSSDTKTETEWFPFDSKTHFLLTSLYSSKTHRVADDMERHGHLLHYTEDSFEKNHKTIKSSISHQNGHARSRDTASQFANNELMSHVIVGGFLQNSKKW
ncbi:uncharacterized protein LOC127719306 [Mytilus californianus]|uniref:uncharacterized protein LOC127719306 n=1 Tax=Mytilus californianus TaxID=6549 RepID=UPI0022476D69|nr:uncharacterized protein LOC127719306 [Mytilus californianus]